MNHYQRAGTFIVRLVGLVMAAVGLMGLSHLAFLQMTGGETAALPHQRQIGSVVWTVFGVLLVLVAKCVGGYLGKGLE